MGSTLRPGCIYPTTNGARARILSEQADGDFVGEILGGADGALVQGYGRWNLQGIAVGGGPNIDLDSALRGLQIGKPLKEAIESGQPLSVADAPLLQVGVQMGVAYKTRNGGLISVCNVESLQGSKLFTGMILSVGKLGEADARIHRSGDKLMFNRNGVCRGSAGFKDVTMFDLMEEVV